MALLGALNGASTAVAERQLAPWPTRQGGRLMYQMKPRTIRPRAAIANTAARSAPAPDVAAPIAIAIVNGPMKTRSCAVRRKQSMFFQKIANAG